MPAMAGDTTRNVPWDDDDDDFGALPANEGDYGWGSADPLGSEDVADQVLTALFTVTNPAGTVSATAAIGGRVQQVDLSANVVNMTEAQLADEIVVLADLASQKAQAAQHAVIVELMRTMGHDPIVSSGFIEHDLGMPSPETVDARRAQVFAARYARQDDQGSCGGDL